MRRLPITLMLLLAVALPTVAPAQPTTTSYQGQLIVDGSLYNGSADFKFAIMCGTAIRWSNDGSLGVVVEPAAAVTLTVDAGVFSVILGDPLLGMAPINPSFMRCTTPPMLRVWVDTGTGFIQLSDSQIASSLFALRSDYAKRSQGNFTVEEGAIVLMDEQTQATVDLDPQGAESGEGAGLRMSNWNGDTTINIMAGINSGHTPEIRLYDDLGNENITLKGANGEIEVDQIRFPDDTVQTTAAVGSGADTDWVESGNDVYRTIGNVGIGTNAPSSRLHISDTGSVKVHIEADSDNVGEGDQPLLRISQDGGLLAGELGFTESSNRFEIMRIDQGDSLTLSFGTLGLRNLDIDGDMIFGGGAGKADGTSEVLHIRGRSGPWIVGVENTNFESSTDFFIGLSSTDLDVFKIERDGDVGIGTATPSAKLDIVGDLEVNGVVNVSPMTRYLAIPAGAFTPELDTMDYKQNGYNVYGTTPNQLVRFWAPVQLPHGAVIKEFLVVVDDLESLASFTATAYLYEWPHFGGSGTIISHRFTVGAPGAYAVLSEAENFAVDNENNTYFMSVDWDTPSSGSVWDMRLRSARITYEITQLAP